MSARSRAAALPQPLPRKDARSHAPYPPQQPLVGATEGQSLRGDLRRATEWEPATLPHDAMITGERSPSAGAANGYFVGGNWEYRRAFDATADDAAVMTLEFEGVYRDAVVSVNGAAAAHRPYGYSNFFVPIDHLVRRDGENEVRVEVRAGDDSRWYSGAGIYRNVWLLSAGPVFLVPDGLQVRTPEIDAAGAVVTVAADVRNRSQASSRPTLAVELVDGDGAVVARSETPVTTFPGDTITARTRLHVVDARRWGPDDPYLYTCRAMLARRRRHHRRGVDDLRHPVTRRRSRNEGCGSTANRCCSAAPASTTTTECSAPRRSTVLTSDAWSCCRPPVTTRSAARTTR